MAQCSHDLYSHASAHQFAPRSVVAPELLPPPIFSAVSRSKPCPRLTVLTAAHVHHFQWKRNLLCSLPHTSTPASNIRTDSSHSGLQNQASIARPARTANKSHRSFHCLAAYSQPIAQACCDAKLRSCPALRERLFCITPRLRLRISKRPPSGPAPSVLYAPAHIFSLAPRPLRLDLPSGHHQQPTASELVQYTQ